MPADYDYMALNITMVRIQPQNKIKLYTMIYMICDVHNIHIIGRF